MHPEDSKFFLLRLQCHEENLIAKINLSSSFRFTFRSPLEIYTLHTPKAAISGVVLVWH